MNMKLQSSFEFGQTINGQYWIITIETYKTMQYAIAQRFGWAFSSYCERVPKGIDAVKYITDMIKYNK
jgi:hypothetical protein